MSETGGACCGSTDSSSCGGVRSFVRSDAPCCTSMQGGATRADVEDRLTCSLCGSGSGSSSGSGSGAGSCQGSGPGPGTGSTCSNTTEGAIVGGDAGPTAGVGAKACSAICRLCSIPAGLSSATKLAVPPPPTTPVSPEAVPATAAASPLPPLFNNRPLPPRIKDLSSNISETNSCSSCIARTPEENRAKICSIATQALASTSRRSRMARAARCRTTEPPPPPAGPLTLLALNRRRPPSGAQSVVATGSSNRSQMRSTTDHGSVFTKRQLNHCTTRESTGQPRHDMCSSNAAPPPLHLNARESLTSETNTEVSTCAVVMPVLL